MHKYFGLIFDVEIKGEVKVLIIKDVQFFIKMCIIKLFIIELMAI